MTKIVVDRVYTPTVKGKGIKYSTIIVEVKNTLVYNHLLLLLAELHYLLIKIFLNLIGKSMHF